MARRDPAELLARIRRALEAGDFRVTQHAQQEMVEEEISLAEVLQTAVAAVVLEDYPEHRRGACCLLCGETAEGRPLHVVCTTDLPVVILITTYEPKPPRWVNPYRRGGTG